MPFTSGSSAPAAPRRQVLVGVHGCVLLWRRCLFRGRPWRWREGCRREGCLIEIMKALLPKLLGTMFPIFFSKCCNGPAIPQTPCAETSMLAATDVQSGLWTLPFHEQLFSKLLERTYCTNSGLLGSGLGFGSVFRITVYVWSYVYVQVSHCYC